MKCTFIGWCRLIGDAPGTASKITSAEIETGRKSAKTIALDLDTYSDEYGKSFGNFPPTYGHGITVVYPSGRKRTFHTLKGRK